jgi:hypothetical protein
MSFTRVAHKMKKESPNDESRMKCTFAHRMPHSRSHKPILAIVRAAGINLYASIEILPKTATIGSPRMTRSQEDLWMKNRDAEIRGIQQRRTSRRILADESQILKDIAKVSTEGTSTTGCELMPPLLSIPDLAEDDYEQGEEDLCGIDDCTIVKVGDTALSK